VRVSFRLAIFSGPFFPIGYDGAGSTFGCEMIFTKLLDLTLAIQMK
jgi:hypothetical protein